MRDHRTIGARAGVDRQQLLAGRGHVDAFEISEDGRHVVYLADDETAGVFDLYVAPTQGGPARRLDHRVGPGGAVWSFQVCGEGVVYRAQRSDVAPTELFTVGLAGGQPMRLHEELGVGCEIPGFATAPTGVIAFVIAGGPTRPDELHAVTVPRQQSRLLARVRTGHRIDPDIQLSHDGAHAVYLADQRAAGRDELYGMPVDGGDPLRLNREFAEEASVQEFRVSPDSARVLYITEDGTGTRQLWTASLPSRRLAG